MSNSPHPSRSDRRLNRYSLNQENLQNTDEQPTKESITQERHIKMELDPPPSGQPEIGMTYTMEQWDALFPPREQVQKPRQASLEKAESFVVPLPVEHTTGESAGKFTHMCQQRGLRSTFKFDEVAKGCFSVRVEFGDRVCEEAGPYASKKQAKEAICRRACGILEDIPIPPKKKRKSSDMASLDEENWKAKLNDHSQKMKHRPAQYQDHEISMRDQQKEGSSTSSVMFACTLMIEAAPGQTFGSKLTTYPTKVEARRVAAKEAVLWLRATGLISESSKQRKLSDPGNHTGLTQRMASVTTDQSAAQMVVERSLQLGLSQPSYHVTLADAPAGASGPSFYVAHARYSPQDAQKEPRLQGQLCETGAVYGQKNAKQECVQRLLNLLDGIVAERRNG